jgi:putative hydrolase of the HAD superfamily
MIMLDIDDTLIDYSGAEKIASLKFGEIFSLKIPDYNKIVFPNLWHELMLKYYQEFLNGRMSYHDQRRNRIRTIFQDQTIANDQADELYSIYKNIYEENWQLFDDVIPFLEKYTNNGFVAITDGQQAQQENKLLKTGILKYFKTVITAEKTKLSKPNREIFNIAIDYVKLKPNQCAYIGDNLEKDAIGAKNSGMIGIWLNRKSIKQIHNVMEITSLDKFHLLNIESNVTS